MADQSVIFLCERNLTDVRQIHELLIGSLGEAFQKASEAVRGGASPSTWKKKAIEDFELIDETEMIRSRFIFSVKFSLHLWITMSDAARFVSTAEEKVKASEASVRSAMASKQYEYDVDVYRAVGLETADAARAVDASSQALAEAEVVLQKHEGEQTHEDEQFPAETRGLEEMRKEYQELEKRRDTTRDKLTAVEAPLRAEERAEYFLTMLVLALVGPEDRQRTSISGPADQQTAIDKAQLELASAAEYARAMSGENEPADVLVQLAVENINHILNTAQASTTLHDERKIGREALSNYHRDRTGDDEDATARAYANLVMADQTARAQITIISKEAVKLTAAYPTVQWFVKSGEQEFNFSIVTIEFSQTMSQAERAVTTAESSVASGWSACEKHDYATAFATAKNARNAVAASSVALAEAKKILEPWSNKIRELLHYNATLQSGLLPDFLPGGSRKDVRKWASGVVREEGYKQLKQDEHQATFFQHMSEEYKQLNIRHGEVDEELTALLAAMPTKFVKYLKGFETQAATEAAAFQKAKGKDGAQAEAALRGLAEEVRGFREVFDQLPESLLESVGAEAGQISIAVSQTLRETISGLIGENSQNIRDARMQVDNANQGGGDDVDIEWVRWVIGYAEWSRTQIESEALQNVIPEDDVATLNTAVETYLVAAVDELKLSAAELFKRADARASEEPSDESGWPRRVATPPTVPSGDGAAVPQGPGTSESLPQLTVVDRGVSGGGSPKSPALTPRALDEDEGPRQLPAVDPAVSDGVAGSLILPKAPALTPPAPAVDESLVQPAVDESLVDRGVSVGAASRPPPSPNALPLTPPLSGQSATLVANMPPVVDLDRGVSVGAASSPPSSPNATPQGPGADESLVQVQPPVVDRGVSGGGASTPPSSPKAAAVTPPVSGQPAIRIPVANTPPVVDRGVSVGGASTPPSSPKAAPVTSPVSSQPVTPDANTAFLATVPSSEPEPPETTGPNSDETTDQTEPESSAPTQSDGAGVLRADETTSATAVATLKQYSIDCNAILAALQAKIDVGFFVHGVLVIYIFALRRHIRISVLSAWNGVSKNQISIL